MGSFDFWIKVIPIVIAIISLIFSIRVSIRNHKITENLHQPQLKFIYVFDKLWCDNELILSVDNLGSNIYKIQKVVWEQDKTIKVEHFKGLLVITDEKGEVVNERFRKDVLQLRLTFNNSNNVEGNIKIHYIDMNGKKKTVWSPKIRIDENGNLNKTGIMYEFFTKLK